MSSKITDFIKQAEELGFDKIWEKTYVQEEKILMSIKSSTDGETYLDYLKREGYSIKKILTWDVDNNRTDLLVDKTNAEYYYYHREYGFLLHFDSYGASVNGASMYFNAIPKEGKDFFPKINSSGGSVRYASTDSGKWILAGDVDARDSLAWKIKGLLATHHPLRQWAEFKQSGYSYLSHPKSENKKEDYAQWDTILVSKLKDFPLDVLRNLFEKNVIFSNPLHDKKDLKDFIISKLGKINVLKMKDFVKQIPNEMLSEFKFRTYLFDESPTYINEMFTDSLNQFAEQHGFSKKMLIRYWPTIMRECHKRKDSDKSLNASDKTKENIVNAINDVATLDFVIEKHSTQSFGFHIEEPLKTIILKRKHFLMEKSDLPAKPAIKLKTKLKLT